MSQTIRLAGVVRESIVDGPGIRFVVFVQGCPHHCPGCHNPESHAFDGGYDCELEKILAAIDQNPLLSGVTLSGGEPFCQAKALLPLAKAVKERGLHLISYSGWTFEELLESKDPAVRPLLDLCDILVDGRYVEALRDLTLRFRGSSNQRLLDVPASLACGSAVWAQLAD
ncbi:MAG: anaerobic ribonucleoside-triphosphate reductase activating protein [Oscillospiraceae bacterium]|nr:anaerobic ribonucleoside-triphosphate reductase activating protein [Oscillospiraceae bacterium]